MSRASWHEIEQRRRSAAGSRRPRDRASLRNAAARCEEQRPPSDCDPSWCRLARRSRADRTKVPWTLAWGSAMSHVVAVRHDLRGRPLSTTWLCRPGRMPRCVPSLTPAAQVAQDRGRVGQGYLRPPAPLGNGKEGNGREWQLCRLLPPLGPARVEPGRAGHVHKVVVTDPGSVLAASAAAGAGSRLPMHLAAAGGARPNHPSNRGDS